MSLTTIVHYLTIIIHYLTSIVHYFAIRHRILNPTYFHSRNLWKLERIRTSTKSLEPSKGPWKKFLRGTRV